MGFGNSLLQYKLNAKCLFNRVLLVGMYSSSKGNDIFRSICLNKRHAANRILQQLACWFGGGFLFVFYMKGISEKNNSKFIPE